MKESINFTITASTRLHLSYEDGNDFCKLKTTSLLLEVSDEMPKEHFLQSNGDPTEGGLRAIDNALIAGLAVSVNIGAQKGWDSRKAHIERLVQKLRDMTDHNEDDVVIQTNW